MQHALAFKWHKEKLSCMFIWSASIESNSQTIENDITVTINDWWLICQSILTFNNVCSVSSFMQSFLLVMIKCSVTDFITDLGKQHKLSDSVGRTETDKQEIRTNII